MVTKVVVLMVETISTHSPSISPCLPLPSLSLSLSFSLSLSPYISHSLSPLPPSLSLSPCLPLPPLSLSLSPPSVPLFLPLSLPPSLTLSPPPALSISPYPLSLPPYLSHPPPPLSLSQIPPLKIHLIRYKGVDIRFLSLFCGRGLHSQVALFLPGGCGMGTILGCLTRH